MTENNTPQHPGIYVRENLIPKGMNVTSAAKKLDVSRVALSNFLNGKSDLSQEMAARLENDHRVAGRDSFSEKRAAARRAGQDGVISTSFVPQDFEAAAIG